MPEIYGFYYVIQNTVTSQYVAIDNPSGGYPSLVDDFTVARQFHSIESAEELLNGGNFNCAYKTSFPKECGNAEIKKVVTMAHIE